MICAAVASFAQTTTTTSDGNWNDPLNWDNGVPTSSLDAVILHDITLNVNGAAKDLTVGNPTGSLTNSNRSLDIHGDLTVNDPADWIETGTGKTKYRSTGSITGNIYFQELQVIAIGSTITANDTIFINDFLKLASGTLDVTGGGLVFISNATEEGNLGFSNAGVLNGNYVWQKYIDRCNEWSSYSAPVNATLTQIAANTEGRMIYTGFPDSDHPGFPFVNTYFYDETSGYTVPTSTSNTLNRGNGYWYWNTDSVYQSSESSIPQQWTIELVGTTSLSGTFDYGVTFGNTNWNLIGNPYPGVLDWNSGYWTKTNVNDAVYYWNTCTQSYASYVNGVGSNGGERFIPAGQGFFIETNAAGPVLQSTQRILSNVNNRTVKNQDPMLDQVVITLNGDQTILTFDENATQDFDGGFDAKKLIAPFFVNDLSAIKTVYNNIDYSVNTLPFEDITLPMDVKGEGEITFTGANLFDDVNIYLFDKVTGDVVDMKIFQSYTFSNEEKEFTDRFNIIVKKNNSIVASSNAITELSIFPNPTKDRINVMSNDGFDKVEVYNTLGELVISKEAMTNNVSIDMSDLNTGVYFVKIFNNANVVAVEMTQKL